MMLNAYSLLDIKSGAYAPPFFLHHDSQAIRAVSELGQDRSTTVARYPADFALCRVGVFDDQTGYMRTDEVLNLGLVVAFLPMPAKAMTLFPEPSQPELAMLPNGAERASQKDA